MKKIILFILVLLCNGVAFGQWNKSLTGQTSLVDNMSLVKDTTLWIKDQTGESVSLSNNSGKSWITKKLPEVMINGGTGGFCAVSNTTAYMIVSNADKGVYKTTDGGDTWTKQSTGFTASSPWPDFVYFWNGNDGVCVGDASGDVNFEIYTTSNGGEQWNSVNVSNIPQVRNEYTFGSNMYFRVHGNTLYFLTSTSRIFKTSDKGLTWTVINTPLNGFDINNVSFDFKDDLHGLISYYSSSTGSLLYSTSDGGANWIPINTSDFFENLFYNETIGTYFSTHANYGLSYSKDDGQTWTIHPTFSNIGLSAVAASSTGEIFMGGWKYVYHSTNYEGKNIAIKDVRVLGSNSINVKYSMVPDPVSAQNNSNYLLKYYKDGNAMTLTVQNVALDQTNDSTVCLTVSESVPVDTISLSITNVTDNNSGSRFSLIDDDVLIYNQVYIDVPGSLITRLTTEELSGLKSITINGTIDARDFKTMRDNMPILGTVNLYHANVAAYSGTEGSAGASVSSYSKNEIPDYAFADPVTLNGKSVLQKITFPSNISRIGNCAFVNTGLKTLSLPDSLQHIGQSAFNCCWDIDGEIVFPSSLTTIGGYAFAFCSGISSIYIPASVITIDDAAFGGLNGAITVDSENLYFFVSDEVLYNKDETKLIVCPVYKSGNYDILSSVKTIGYYAFVNCNQLTSVRIPEGTTRIESLAFSGCTGLTSVSIPAGVNYIGFDAFENCSGLTSIHAYAVEPVDLQSSSDVFKNVNYASCILYVPVGAKGAYESAYQWKDFTHIVEFDVSALENPENAMLPMITNPSTRTLLITNLKGLTTVSIINAEGKLYMVRKLTDGASSVAFCLPAGVYIVNIDNSQGVVSRKVVVW